MKSKCIQQIEAAIKRSLGKGEAQRIEARLTNNLKELARTDPAFQGMSQAERLTAAAKLSLDQDTIEAAKALQRKTSNIVAQTREVQSLANRSRVLGSYHEALFERLNQVNNYVTGVKNELFSNLVDTINAAEPRFMALLENAKATHDFVREVYGEKTGNQIAQKGAKAYLEVIEHIRLRLNSAGMSIGKLDYGYLPQPHDAAAIGKAGKNAWVASVLSKLDTNRYFNSDGSLMNQAQLTAFLDHAYDTLATDGVVRREAGQGGVGSRAARMDEAHRSLHFKDAQSYVDYMNEFGSGSVFESIHNHVNAQGKNIGLLESLGANPNQTYSMMKDTAEIQDSTAAGKAVVGVRKYGATADMAWGILNGSTATPVDPKLAYRAQQIRNYTSATKLGGVMLSSINDAATWNATARFNGIPMGKALKGMFKSLGANTEDAARLALATESMSGEMATWHADNMRQDWTGKLANTTMKLGFVESWTHRLRSGLGMMLQDQLATLKNTDWDKLSTFDRERFTVSGVTEKDWRIWQVAQPEIISNRPMLTKNSIRNVSAKWATDSDINQATAKLVGFLDNEAKTAVLGPDLLTRATITQGHQAGTWGGEIGRSLMLFKSFPAAIITRNIDRINLLSRTKGTAAAFRYSVSLLASMTLIGALSIELKDMVQGKDPRDATTPKFWGAAFAQGGGLGIFGDMLYTGLGGNSRGGQTNWTNLAGPIAGTAADLGNVTLGNIGQAMQGKDTKAGAEALRFTRQNLPFLNLWYAKAAIDHAGFNELQEWASPGYLSRNRAAAKRDWGSTYWWENNQTLPDRAPDITSVVGQP